jgi:hypothetical protein
MTQADEPDPIATSPPSSDGPRAAFIILSYARPQNMQRILDAVLAARSCDHILLSNNNPDIDIFDHIARDQPDRVKVAQQKERWEPVSRFIFARNMPDDYFVCIDDDLFLTPAQIDALVSHLHADPAVPHGVWGEHVRLVEGVFQITPGVHNFDGEVDTINRAYAFTHPHVRRYFELLGLVGVKRPRSLGRGDDIVLSFSGERKPFCHDLGPLEDCPTADDKELALWRNENFYDARIRLYARLREVTGRD